MCRQDEACRCTITSLLCPTPPTSTAAPVSPAKAWDISIALMWVCVEKRWEAVVLVAFIWVKFSLMLKPAVLHLQGRVPATCVENVTESGREIDHSPSFYQPLSFFIDLVWFMRNQHVNMLWSCTLKYFLMTRVGVFKKPTCAGKYFSLTW